MINRTPTLAEWPYRMVRLACDLAPRRGQYRKDTIVAFRLVSRSSKLEVVTMITEIVLFRLPEGIAAKTPWPNIDLACRFGRLTPT
jgi:hypothetical protein